MPKIFVFLNTKMKLFSIDIEKETLLNEEYRKEIYLDNNMKITLMSLKPGESIPLEIHEYTTQFIRIEYGFGTIESPQDKIKIRDGIAIVIPQATKHVVQNKGQRHLKLYSIYCGGDVKNP